jgi:tRNA-splicing ligase RtcB
VNIPIHSWLSHKPDPELERAIHALRGLPNARHLAIMPDAHPAGEFCVGAVLATSTLVYPGAVGGDIGCGMSALRLLGSAEALAEPGAATAALQAIENAVPILRHRKTTGRIPSCGPNPDALSDPRLTGHARRNAPGEIGTLGRGNHFVELQLDDTGAPWLVVHSGSRSMGQAIAAHHTGIARAERHRTPALDASTPAGRAYLADVAWAEEYAAANRLHMLATAARILRARFGWSPDPDSLIDSSHNHVREESHGGARLLVHRKGAAPAPAGARGIIPAAMGRDTYHVQGRGHPDSLSSSSHGAGRAHSRAEAARRFTTRDLRQALAGIVVNPRLLPRLLDEAPGAYKDPRQVMQAQRDLIAMTGRARPLLIHKGG